MAALRIHHHPGDDVNTQANSPLSLLRRATDDSDAAPYTTKEGELNAAGGDFSHRQAKEVTKGARPFLSRKFDRYFVENKRLGNSRVSMFDDQRNLEGSLSLSMMGAADYLWKPGKANAGKSTAGKTEKWKPTKDDIHLSGTTVYKVEK